jgi:prephenate dehydrogenase
MDAAIREALSTADLVILALPETIAIEIWPNIASCLQGGALVVDTLSVKSRFVEAYQVSGVSNTLLSINPMFAPSVGFDGGNVAVVRLGNSRLSDAFLTLLSGWGARLTFLDAGEHDDISAVVQTATHAAILAFGMAVRESGRDVSSLEPMMTPPHRVMLALLARMLNAAPEVYWEIQSENPHANDVRAGLAAGMQRLSQVVEDGDLKAFKSLMEELRKVYDSGSASRFSSLAAEIVAKTLPLP